MANRVTTGGPRDEPIPEPRKRWRCELVCADCGAVFSAAAERGADGRLELDALCSRCRAEALPAATDAEKDESVAKRRDGPRTLREALVRRREEP